MLLPEDDMGFIEIDDSALHIKTDQTKIYKPQKPVICRFFKPKPNNVVSHNKLADMKISISTDIDESCQVYDYKLIKIPINMNSIPDDLNLQSMPLSSELFKTESFVKKETELSTLYPSFSPTTESSSLSNLPNISCTCSKSTISLSDSDNQEVSSSLKSLIVTDVVSINNPSETHPVPRIETCIKSCDNSISFVRKSLVKTVDLPLSTFNSAEKSHSDSNNDTEKALERISSVFKLVKQSKNDKMPRNDEEALSSGSSTDVMMDDIYDEPHYDSMQPTVVLEPLQLEKLTSRKRPFSNSVSKPGPKSKKARGTMLLRSNMSVGDSGSGLMSSMKTESNTTTSTPVKKAGRSKKKLSTVAINHSMSTIIKTSLIYCFQCKMNMRELCRDHPVEWICNEDVDCPFVEYLTDESYDKYWRKVAPNFESVNCDCKQNELDHIQISLPRQFVLKESQKSQLAIWTKSKIKQGTIIGPYLGEIVDHGMVDKIGCIKTRRSSKQPAFDELLFLKDAFKSNWMRYVNITCNENQANLMILRHEGKLFFRAFKAIGVNVELFVCSKIHFDSVKPKDAPQFARSISRRETEDISLDKDHLHIPVKVPKNPETVQLTDEFIDSLSYKGYKFRREVISEIMRMSNLDSQMTSTDILKKLHCEFPDLTGMTESCLSHVTGRLKLRTRGGHNVKFDDEILAYISQLLDQSPDIHSRQISDMIASKFPDKPRILDMSVNQIIRRHKLRPLRGMDEHVDRRQVESIVEMFTDNTRLELREARDRLWRQMPDKPRLDVHTIDRIVKLNYCRLKGDKTNWRLDPDVVEEVKSCLSREPHATTEAVCQHVKRSRPDKAHLVTARYIGLVINKCQLRPKLPNGIKLDDEMRMVIYKLHLDNPRHSANKINFQLRQLMPDKPSISMASVSAAIQQFRAANQDH